jgi:hypothetical protein
MNRRALTVANRLDAVAGALAHFQRAMMMDVDQAAKAMREEEMLQEIEDFLEGFNQPTYRGMRINGQRVATWSSEHGWSGDGRPDAEWNTVSPRRAHQAAASFIRFITRSCCCLSVATTSQAVSSGLNSGNA